MQEGTPIVVSKRTVEVIEVLDQELNRDAAVKLYKALGDVLGMPRFENKGCSDRYSHGPHLHGSNYHLYCRGLAFDRT